MQQEMLESKGPQADPVQNHRFRLVPPGALGVYKPDSFNCNQVNKRHLAILLRNLSKMIFINNETRKDAIVGYCCKYCRRSLYIPEYRATHVVCTCLRCVSVLYCSAVCRNDDAREHQFSCFLHPGWECEESTKRRLEKMNTAGLKEKVLKDVRIPEIVAEARPEAEQGTAEQGTAEQEEDLEIVTVEGCEQQSATAAQESVGNTIVSI